MCHKLAKLVWLIAGLFVVTGTLHAEAVISFQNDVLPVLSDHCFACHGPDGGNRKAELRLDLEEEAKAWAITPGNAQDSEVYRRITSADPDLKMPPSDSARTLTNEEIEKIRVWIDAGAKWEKHWAFVTPVKPEVPKVTSNAAVKNEIDAFVVAKLEQEGLTPAKRATKEQLIRRLSFDLTGLPPTLQEIDDFLSDESPDAYERVVDRLLASDSYGERMTSDWLDVARYSDSYGFQVDRDRFVWPWRDWVIKSFNQNLPYDEFITQQIAGDLLPNATDAQILATTFCRLHPQESEGGSVPEEYRVEYVSDRTHTVATAFLGLTFECCRCHDHKYDPFSQKEYYELTSFFDNIDEAGLYSYFTDAIPTPTLRLMDEARKSQLAEFRKECRQAELGVADAQSHAVKKYFKWKENPNTFVPATPMGQIVHLDFEGEAPKDTKLVPSTHGNGVQLSGDKGIYLDVGNFQRQEPFSVSLWMNTPDVKERAVIFHRSRAWTDAGSRGYELLLDEGKLAFSLIHFWPGNAISIRTKDLLPVGTWHHVAVTYNGSSLASGLGIFIDGKKAAVDVIRDQLSKQITGGDSTYVDANGKKIFDVRSNSIAIGERYRDRGFTEGLIDEFRVFTRQLTPWEIAHLLNEQSSTEALEMSRSSHAQNDEKGLQTFYQFNFDEEFKSSLSMLQKARERLFHLEDGTQEIMVMRELHSPRTTYLLARGAYDARTEEVLSKTPASLLDFPDNLPDNRLGLAKWITAPNHPLTARVAVNRFWQTIFGNGLVRTPEDFGRQGQRPTHPELLDWLSRDFIEHGWDVKRLIKQMVMSSTYQQSTDVSDEAVAKDPLNLLLSHASSHRLSAEMLRDNALSVSGLLVRRCGGPPAHPYEVEASFKPVKRSTGEGLYRRSLYTYWKRTDPAPVMMTLDASKRDVCQMRRERTSTPLEAFVLMNGPQFVEAARMLCQKLLIKPDNDDLPLISLFRILTGRYPTEKELDVLQQLYSVQLAYFQEDANRATQYLDYGDTKPTESIDPIPLAALTSVANALFSFDEVVNRR